MEDIVARRIGKKEIGFNVKNKSTQKLSKGDLYGMTEPEDLLEYGLIPELIGRLPVVSSLDDLDEKALKAILTKPKNALVKQYTKLMELENGDLSIERIKNGLEHYPLLNDAFLEWMIKYSNISENSKEIYGFGNKTIYDIHERRQYIRACFIL